MVRVVAVVQDVLALLPDAEVLQSGLGVEGNDRTLLREAVSGRRRGHIQVMNSRCAGRVLEAGSEVSPARC